MGCHTWHITPEARQSNTRPLKKFGISITFAKNSPVKVSARNSYGFTSAIEKKANTYCSYVIAKWASKLRNAVGKRESQPWFKKLKNFTTFFDDNWPRKNFFDWNYFNTPLNQIKFNWLVQKFSNSKPTLKTGAKIVASAFYEIRKLNFFRQ